MKNKEWVRLQSNSNKTNNIKLIAYRNSFFTVFLAYGFFVVFNDMFLNQEYDYKYIFSVTFVLMIAVFYISIFISNIRKNKWFFGK